MMAKRCMFRCVPVLLLALVPAGLLSACAAKERSGAEIMSAVISERQTAARYNLNTEWWRGYGLAALDRTVELALERNTDLAASAVAVNRAQYEARLITSDLLPGFSAGGSASVSRNLKPGHHLEDGKTWRESWQGEAAMSYELDLWRRLRDAYDAKAWEYRASMEDLAGARLALVNSVVSAWFRLMYTEQSITLVERNTETYRRILEIARARYREGKATVVEPLQAEQSLFNAGNILTELRTQRAETLETLRNLCNMRPGETPPPPDGADIMAVAAVPVDLNVPIAALAARPDIHAAQARLEGAFKNLEADRAAWFPRLTVGSTLNLSSDTAGRFFNVPLLTGLASLSLPFLDWNTLRWNVKISEADFESARLSLVQSLTTALNEVDTACASYVLARQTLEQTQQVHERDRRIAAYYGTRHAQGRESLKDYLEALATADNSALSVLSARYTLLTWENGIYKAMGGRYEPKQQGSAD